MVSTPIQTPAEAGQAFPQEEGTHSLHINSPLTAQNSSLTAHHSPLFFPPVSKKSRLVYEFNKLVK
jgi:hypothetical protein